MQGKTQHGLWLFLSLMDKLTASGIVLCKSNRVPLNAQKGHGEMMWLKV